MTDDPMRYDMLGDDGLTGEQRLDKYSGPVSYDYLLGPLRNGVLITVHEALDLRAVGLAFLHDDKRRVQAWLDEQLLEIATEPTFEKRDGAEAYQVIVVSPFVLVR